MSLKPEITAVSLLNLQVCVPKEYTDAEALAFAQTEHPAGTTNNWDMCGPGHKCLAGDPYRAPCDERPNCVHILFVC